MARPRRDRDVTLRLTLFCGASVLILACGGDDAPSPTVPTPAPPALPLSPPRAPTNLRISDSGPYFLEWSWDRVEDVDGYRVQFSENEAFSDDDDVIPRTAEELSYRRENLAAETSAYLRVQSVVGSAGQMVTSDWSAHVIGKTGPPVPAVLVSPAELFVTEGETIALSVRLATPPTAPVTVAVSVQADAGLFRELGKGFPLEITPGSRLAFDADAWDSRQTVELVAGHDFDAVDEEVFIYFDTTSDDSVYENLPRRALPAHVTDDESEPLGIFVFGHQRSGPPEGGSRIYGVSLTGEPTGEVFVTVTSSDPGVLEVTEGSELSFTPHDYGMLQWFSLTAVQGRPFGTASIRLEASGGGYDGVFAQAYLRPPRADQMDPVVLSPVEIALVEGSEGSFGMHLATPAEVDVEVTVYSYAPETLSIEDGEPHRQCWFPNGGCWDTVRRKFVFSALDWMIAQEVNLIAHQDNDAENEEVVLVLRASDHIRPNTVSNRRGGGGGQVLTVRIHDDDLP